VTLLHKSNAIFNGDRYAVRYIQVVFMKHNKTDAFTLLMCSFGGLLCLVNKPYHAKRYSGQIQREKRVVPM